MNEDIYRSPDAGCPACGRADKLDPIYPLISEAADDDERREYYREIESGEIEPEGFECMFCGYSTLWE